jgi:hypothetical protein
MSLNEVELCDAIDSLATFKAAAGPRVGPYFTPSVEEANTRVLAEWIVANLPGGVAATQQVGAFEIAFRECLKLGKLTADPAFVAPKTEAERRDLFNLLDASLLTAQAKDIYFEANTAKPLTIAQRQALDEIGGPAAFRRFFDEKN